MNKTIFINRTLKVSFTACLFLFTDYAAKGNDLQFDAHTEKAYNLVLNLELEEASAVLSDPRTISDYYTLSLAESLELLLTENPERFGDYEERFHQRLDKKIKGREAEYQFLQAEIRLQWAFVYLKFGHEFDAALNLREAFRIADGCRKKNPKYLPIRKTTGLLEVIIGSVPEKYNWVLSLLGMEGSIEDGLKDLEAVRTSTSPLAFETDLLYALIQGFVFQKPDVALAEVKQLLADKNDNRLLLFLGASLAIKNAESAYASTLLEVFNNAEKGIPIYYTDYLKAETSLHKADYVQAISSYRWFINNYKGQNYIKDAYYKIGLCYWLNGKENEALAAFKQARTKGKESCEADKYAARSLADKELPHIKLSKVRYFTDGGYYAEAHEALAIITSPDLPTQRDRTEFHYRQARLAHKQNALDSAKAFYLQTIETAGQESWYFAPNSCLQLGYITLAEDNIDEAKRYFNRALDYKKHEYKNSIDSKAKSALAQIKRK